MCPYRIANIPHHTISITCNGPGSAIMYRRIIGQASVCCIFADTEDYKSFLALRKLPLLTLPEECDCFIMESVTNFLYITVEADVYDRIYLFLPLDVAWQTIEKTMKARNQNHVCSFTPLYKGYKTLHKFVDEFSKNVE